MFVVVFVVVIVSDFRKIWSEIAGILTLLLLILLLLTDGWMLGQMDGLTGARLDGCTMVQNKLILRHQNSSLEESEDRASLRESAVEYKSEASRVEQVNEPCERMNK